MSEKKATTYLLAVLATLSLSLTAESPLAQTENLCGELPPGAAYDLCSAGVAVGCHDGTGNVTACARIEDNYLKLMGEVAPWLRLSPPCPCAESFADAIATYNTIVPRQVPPFDLCEEFQPERWNAEDIQQATNNTYLIFLATEFTRPLCQTYVVKIAPVFYDYYNYETTLSDAQLTACNRFISSLQPDCASIPQAE